MSTALFSWQKSLRKDATSVAGQRLIFVLALTLLLLAGCGSDDDDGDAAEPTPTATTAAVATPTPTDEPEPTSTPEPESTATATAEPEPTASPTSEPTATSEPDPTATTEPAATIETPAGEAEGPAIRISPERGPRSTQFIFVVEGLVPNQRYLLVVRLPDGQEDIYEAVLDPDILTLVIASGEYEGFPIEFWEVVPGEPNGEYTAEIRDVVTDEVLASDTFVVE